MSKITQRIVYIGVFASVLSAPVAQAQQDCKPHYNKFDRVTLMGILDLLDRADKKGVDVVLNNGHALVARKKGKCAIDLEVYDDEEQGVLLCTETVVTCDSKDQKIQ